MSRLTYGEHLVRGALVLIGLPQLGIALWAVITPHGFHHAIADYGAYNVHYIADYAAASAAVGLVLLASIRRTTWRAGALATATAWTGFHAVNHLLDLSAADSAAIGVTTLILLAAATAALGFLTATASGRADL